MTHNLRRNASASDYTAGERVVPGVLSQQPTPGDGDGSIAESTEREVILASVRASPANTQESHNNQIPNSNRSAFSQISEATTNTNPIKRTKWTDEMNKTIVHSYYTVTNLEKNKSGFRKKLHVEFNRKYPDLNFNEQKIAGQLRAIQTKNYIPEEILEQIKHQVEKELNPSEGNLDRDNAQNILLNIRELNQDNPINQCSQGEVTSQNQITVTNGTEVIDLDLTEIRNLSQENQIDRSEQDIIENNQPISDTEETKEIEKQLREEFHKGLTGYGGTDPTTRPNLPKHSSSKKLFQAAQILNQKIIPQYLTENIEFQELHTLIYCGALSLTIVMGKKVVDRNTEQPRTLNSKPPWMKRLEKRIEKIRADLNRIIGYEKGNRSRRLNNHINQIRKQYRVHTKHEDNNTTIVEVRDTIKQKLKALNKRLRRYKETTFRKQDNKQFFNNQKRFYSKLTETEKSENNGTPSKEETQNFWSSLWSEPVLHNDEASWINKEERFVQDITPMNHEEIDEIEVKITTKKTHNWKATGNDNIHNFYLKYFSCTHSYLAKAFNEFIQKPEAIPSFLTSGITYLKPKDSDTKNPSKYRPITCLPNIYKVFTSIIATRLYEHCQSNNIMGIEQKGCIKQSKGCKEQLISDMAITDQVIKQNRNLFTAYIDFKKAYDSVPHSWLAKILDIYKISQPLQNLLQELMKQWQTKLTITDTNKSVETDYIKIKRGIFQGDALSPLWFCLALNPLSNILRRTNKGVHMIHQKQVKYTLSHLLYMDDVKLYAKTEEDLKNFIELTHLFSNDIKMEFGLEKCKTQTIIKGKHITNRIERETLPPIDPMDEQEMYKYLGVLQKKDIDHKTMKKTMKEKYYTRVKLLLKSKLNAKNLINGINTFAIPLLNYTFGIIKWTQTELKDIQTQTNVLMTRHRIHHPKSAIERTTLKRKDGGRGLIDIVNMHNKSIIKLREYFHQKENESPYYAALIKIDKYTPLELNNNNKELPILTDEEKMTRWKHKALHGRYPHEINQEHVDKQASYNWLTHGDLYPETEGFMFAIQDQVIKTNNYKKHILKENLDTDLCRRCKKSSETIHHIIGGCQIIAHKEYKHRHDEVGKIIHQEIALKYKLIKEKNRYYQYTPEKILENKDYELYWDRSILTDKHLEHNRPDIILLKKQEKEAIFIDVAITNDNNMVKTHTEKINKYIDLSYEIKDLWKINKVKIIPIIISNLGTVPKTLFKSIKELELKPYIYQQAQKSVILNTCHIVRRFLYLD